MSIHLSLEHLLDTVVSASNASLLSRVGTSLGEMFSLPEPTTAVLLLSGAAMLVLIIGRR